MMEDGTETHLKNPGDTVIMRGGLHAWKNPTAGWTRWISFLMAAKPVTIEDRVLEPAVA